MDKPGFPQWTILAFAEQLAEGTPMPGGGCAVSVVGALAAALGSLSGQITQKKEADPEQQAHWAALQPRIDQARQDFLDLIDADALAYHQVVLARRRPRQSAAQKEERAEAITQAFAQACEPPRQMARLGLELLEWATLLAQKGNPVILADVGVMGFLAAAVVHGGLVNIFSNLTMMGGGPQAQALKTEAEATRQTLDRQYREFNALMYRQVGAST